MAKKIVLAELDIDINKLINSSTKTQKALDQMRSEVNGLKKSLKENQKALEEDAKKLTHWANTGKTSGKDVDALKLKIAQNKRQIHEQSKALVENTTKLKIVRLNVNHYSNISY